MADLLRTEDAYLWSINTAARAFRVSRDTVSRRIADANLAPAGRKNGHALYAASDLARVCFGEQSTPAAGSDGKVDPEKLPPKERKDWYEGERVRVALEKERGQLVTLDEYQQEMSRVLKEVAFTLETLPDVLERKCALPPAAVIAMQRLLDDQRAALADRVDANE